MPISDHVLRSFEIGDELLDAVATLVAHVLAAAERDNLPPPAEATRVLDLLEEYEELAAIDEPDDEEPA